MAVKIGSLIIQLAVEHGLLKTGLSQAEKEVKKTTREIQQIGRGLVDFGQKMAVAVTLPVAAIAKSAVDGFIEQQKAMADVNAALASMGAVSGKTAAELAKTADQLEMRSLFDAEVILKQVTAQLLTFGRISGQEFDRAQKAALDLAQRMDGDLKGAAIQIGKALNDPIRGVTALNKAGIQFSDGQRAMIRSLVETGNVAAAQRIVLDELETQFNDAAAAAADATPWRAAQVAIGQAMDAIGEAVLPIVTAVADGVTKLAQEFNELSPEMKQTIILAGGIAAAIAPVVIVAGSLIQSTAGITAAFITMQGGAAGAVLGLRNVALAATGLGAVVVALGLDFQQTTALIGAAVTAYSIYRSAIAIAGLATRALASQLAVQAAAVVSSTRVIGGLSAAKFALSGVVGTLTGGLRALTAALVTNPFTAVAAAVGVLAGAMVLLTERQRQARQETTNLILELRALAKAGAADFGAKRQQLAAQISTEQRKLAELRNGRGAGNNLEQALIGRGTRTSGSKEEIAAQTRVVSNLRLELQLMDENFASATKAAQQMAIPVTNAGAAAEGAGKKVRGAADAAKAHADALQSIIDRLFPYQAAERKRAEEMAEIQRSRLSDAEKEAAIARLNEETYRERTRGLGQATVSKGLLGSGPLDAVATVNDHIESIRAQMEKAGARTRAQTVQIAESFRDMADRSIQALDRMANALQGGSFLDILGSVISFGLQLGGMGLFGEKIQASINAPLRGAANGTAFHPGGLLKVGERGPEILSVPRGGRVVPNHELRAAGEQAIRIILDERTDIVAARIDGRIGAASGAIAEGGARIAQSRLARRQTRRIV